MSEPHGGRLALLASTALAVVAALPGSAQANVQADTTVVPPAVVQTIQPGTPESAASIPVDPAAAAQAAAEDAEMAQERAAARSPRRTATRSARAVPALRRPSTTSRTVAPPPAPTAVTTAEPSGPATPVAGTTAALPPPPAAEAPAADERRAMATDTHDATRRSGPPWWPFALVAALIVAAGAFFALRRRHVDDEVAWTTDAPRHDEVVEPPVASAAAEPAMLDRTAPAAIAAGAPFAESDARPVEIAVAAPAAGEAAVVETDDGDDIAALTADGGHADRPWLEFAMRPLRAGTSVDELLVEVELTIGNAGGVSADDVRVATFLLGSDDDAEIERLLIAPASARDATMLSIAPGEGARVDATLAMGRATLSGEAEHATFRPIVVADARYPLANGREGRTCAAFLIGTMDDDGALEPLVLGRIGLSEDVGAELYRAPHHA